MAEKKEEQKALLEEAKINAEIEEQFKKYARYISSKNDAEDQIRELNKQLRALGTDTANAVKINTLKLRIESKEKEVKELATAADDIINASKEKEEAAQRKKDEAEA